MIRYRSLHPSDVETIRQVALRSWRHAYRDIYERATIERQVEDYYSEDKFRKFDFPGIHAGRALFVIVCDGDAPVGYAEVARRGGGWDLSRIYILPEYMGRGIGRELLRRCERFLRQKGARSYTAYIHYRNKDAWQFYLRCRFVRNPARDRGSTSKCFEKRLEGRA